jgi:hypothetical protein
MWEIQRRSKPLGVRLYGDGFKSEFAAKLAGEKALSELLDRLAEQESNPVHSQAVSVDGSNSPSCAHCSGPMKLVRTIPRRGAFPELFVLHCARCGHVETKEQPEGAP